MIASDAWNRRARRGIALMATALGAAGNTIAGGDVPMGGRPAAPVPGQPDRYYERRVLRRSVPLSPEGVESEWYPVLQVLSGFPDLWAAWDREGLSIAVGAAGPEPVCLDIDREGDGFDRGAANYRVVWTPGTPHVSIRRWDRVQNPERGVWAEVPIQGADVGCRISPKRMIVRVGGKTFGTKRGGDVGLRLQSIGSAPFSEPPASSGFLGFELVEEIPAAGAGLTVRLSPRSRAVSDEQPVRAVLEATNVSSGSIELSSWEVVGPAGKIDATAGMVRLAPGATWRREMQLPVPDAEGSRCFAYDARVESGGNVLVARTSVERIEPCTIEVRSDPVPVASGAPDARRARIVQVIVRSQTDRSFDTAVSIVPPPGWTVDGGTRSIRLSYNTEVKGASFKVTPPPGCGPGTYHVETIVTVGKRSLKSKAAIVVMAGQ